MRVDFISGLLSNAFGINPDVKAYVIGHPISHSLSPSIFRILAEVERSTLSYVAVDIAPENLSEFLTSLRADDDFVGANVTIPHKETLLKLVDEATASVKAIGAGNVIQALPKKIKLHNTDIIGIERTLEQKRFLTKNKNILILGAGGSARAFAYQVAKHQAAQITIYNPRSDRGNALSEELQKQFVDTVFHSIQDLSQLSQNKIDLIVNCTPIGMKGESAEFFTQFKALHYSPDALAFDLLYTPSKLPFLTTMKEKGLDTVNGLTMLIEQALATWEIWIGQLQHPGELRVRLKTTLEAILKSRENPKPIYLTGFMGVGKSTVARELSYALNRSFVDTDRWIEEKAHATIPEIFENQGETFFRQLESEAIQVTSSTKNCVIALGGGALTHESNLQVILEHGTLIYLKANEQTLFKRLKKRAHQRPLLADLDEEGLKAKISELLQKRSATYEKAHLKVEIRSEDTPYDTAQTLLTAWGNSA